jgi:hypothetical protein
MAGQQVIVSVVADTGKFSKGLDNANNSLKKLGTGVGRTMKGLATAMGVGAAAVGAFAFASVKVGEEAAAVDRVLNNQLKNLPGIGKGWSDLSKQVDDFATATGNATGIDDELTKSIIAGILPIGEFGDAAENTAAKMQITSIALDTMAATGKDATAVAKQLAKAFTDPTKAIRRLERAGFTFTDSQEAQYNAILKTKGAVEAQNYALDVAQGKYDGAAEAGATATGKLQFQFEQLQEFIAVYLAPIFETVATKLGDFMAEMKDNPKFKKFMEDVGKAAEEFGTFITEDVLPALATFGQWILDNGPFIQFLATTILAVVGALRLYAAIMVIVNIVQAINNGLLYANPITWIVLAIVALIAVIVILIMNWENINKVLQDVWKNIVNWFKGLPKMIESFVKDAGKWLMDTGKNIIDGLLAGLNNAGKAIADFFGNLGDSIVKGWNDFWGIKSPSRKMKKIGQYITKGLELGIRSGTQGVEKAVAGVNNTIGGNLDIQASVGGSGASQGNTYNITVQAVSPNAEVGKAIVNSIREYERIGGSRRLNLA